jgi:hypothetical protein
VSSVIYKYGVPVDDQVHEIELPSGDEPILHVGQQYNDVGRVFFWAWSDTEPDELADYEVRRFLVVGTGHPISRGVKRHIGSVQVGPFVWHLLEVY